MVKANTLISTPARNCSTTTRSLAAPKRAETIISSKLVKASSCVCAMTTPLPAATPSAFNTASSLSGGNKQKVVLARELSRPVKLVVASQPTRGLDVGSIEFVHKRLVEERDQGRAVIVFSTELDEVFALADRIAIMFKGRIIAMVPATESRENIGLYMAGLTPGGTSNA